MRYFFYFAFFLFINFLYGCSENYNIFSNICNKRQDSITSLLFDADAALSDGNYDKAQEIYKKVLQSKAKADRETTIKLVKSIVMSKIASINSDSLSDINVTLIEIAKNPSMFPSVFNDKAKVKEVLSLILQDQSCFNFIENNNVVNNYTIIKTIDLCFEDLIKQIEEEIKNEK
jgi:hypothetical protein